MKHRVPKLVFALTMLSSTPSLVWPGEPEAEAEPGAHETQQTALSHAPGHGGAVPPHHEVTVTATRTPTQVRELGRSVAVVTAEEIASNGFMNLKDVIEYVPGFSVVSAGSFGGQTSVFVRGGESNFNLVLVDGVPVNQPGGEFDFADFSTINVERIEIVKGPSTVLYGADSASSTINIITKEGTDQDPRGFLQIDAGNYNSYMASGSVYGGAERVSYAIGALYSDTDGIHDFNSQYDRAEISGKMSFDISDRDSFTGSFRYSDSEQHFPTDDTGAPVDPNDYRETRQGVYSLSFERALRGSYGTKLLYGYRNYDSTVHTIEDGVSDFFTGKFDTSNSRHYLDWQNNLQIGEGNLLTTGVSLENEDSHDIELDRRSIGLYLQDQFSLQDRLFVTAGARFDNNNRFSNFTTGSLDFAYLLNQNWKLRASVANGFRAPDFGEIIGFPEYGILGNPNLKPEKNIGTDVGIDFFGSSGRGRLTAVFFFNHFSDLIEFTYLAEPGTPNFVNIEKARSRGLEFEGKYNISNNLWAGFSYTLVDTEVLDAGVLSGGSFEAGEPLLRRPMNAANLYSEWIGRSARLRLDIVFKGEREDRQFFPDFSSSRVTLPGYWKVNLSTVIPITGNPGDRPGIALIFRADNLLNKDYVEIAGFQSPGRTIWAGIRFNY